MGRKAEIEKGDVIIAIDGKRIETPAQLRNLVGLMPIGREVNIRYRRGADVADATVRIDSQRNAAVTGMRP